MNYKRILFATDFSPASNAVLRYATALARDSEALLLIVHVEEVPTAYAAGEMYLPPPDYPNPEIRRMLDTVVPTDISVRFEHHLLLGTAAEEIVRAAKDLDADLIVIGTHGRTGLGRVLMGSTAEQVMRHAECPVLTLRQGAATHMDST
jgi:nucleotide-binding universal stress UspA family protein